MKTIVRTKAFADALATCARIIDVRTTMPILQHALLRADGDALLVRTTDLQTTIERRLPGATIAAGAVTADARVLARYVETLAGDEIGLEARSEMLRLDCGSARGEFISFGDDAFPLPESGTERSLREMTGRGFAEAVSATEFMMSDGHEQAGASGGELQIADNGLTLTGTDGYRLARFERGNGERTARLVVPTAGLRTLARIFGELPVMTLKTVGGKENHLLASDGASSVMIRLTEQAYPSTQAIIDAGTTTETRIDRENLRAALKRATPMAENGSRKVGLRIGGELLEMHAESTQYGSGREAIPARTNGPGVEISINGKYLAETLDRIGTQDVRLRFAGPLAPMHIEADEREPDARYVMMPMRA